MRFNRQYGPKAADCGTAMNPTTDPTPSHRTPATARRKLLFDLLGKIEWDDNYDYKRERSRPPHDHAAGKASRPDGNC